MRVNWSIKRNTIDFTTLRPGRCFVYENCLYIKCGFAQYGVRLTDGKACFNMCSTQVTPVNAKVQVID
ncbi:hypothetical protein LCGC14_0948900 [marine sediment metagenome]|uniref:Uncharacterized protein n=1 Tax=marine sediment metagenome TaxID=412755 RepID=A0A0F9NMN0_9ZZZZ